MGAVSLNRFLTCGAITIERLGARRLNFRSELNLLLLTVVLLVLALSATGATRAYTSDDVAQQNAIASLDFHSRAILDLRQNNYIVKLPLYAALNAMPLQPGVKLLITTLILNLTGLLLFYWAARSFVRIFSSTHTATLAPILWLVSLGGGLAGVLVNPNSRNLEIGLGFTALALMARWYKGEYRQAQNLVGPIFVILLGLFFYNDPYFAYMLAAPIIVVFGIKWLLFGRDQRALTLVAVMLTAIVLGKLWYWLFWSIGFRAEQGSAIFAPLAAIPHSAKLFVTGLLELFNANIFGLPVLSISSLGTELNFLGLLTTLLSPLLLVWREIRQDIWKIFLVVQPPFIAIAFIGSGIAVDSGSARYLVLLPFYAVVIVAIILACPSLASRLRNLITTVLLLAAALNVTSTANVYLHRSDNPNAENQEIARIVKEHHLTKGYASYWNAGINQYYAKNEVLFIQSGCSRATGVKPYRTLLNEQVLGRPSRNGFYLFDPAATRCTEADLQRFLGEPRSVVELERQKRLLIYDYDITSRMRSKSTKM